MSSKGSSRSGQVKDKWKMKKWFTVVAPKLFSEVPLGITPAFDSSNALNRKVETTLYDLTGDFSTVHIKVYFKVVGSEGDRLITMFQGHEIARDYIRSLIRRKSSKVQTVTDVTTKDGYSLRVKALALTTYRCQRGQKTAIRKIILDSISKYANESTFDDFVSALLFGKISNELFSVIKEIYPLRNVEIEKSKLLSFPQDRQGDFD